MEENTPIDEEDHGVSLSAALDSASIMLSRIRGGKTRNGSEVSDVEYLPAREYTENLKAVQGFYLVNYGKDAGFALLSADDRRPSVLAISDEGSLHLQDTLENHALSSYLNRDIMSLELLKENNRRKATPIDTAIAPPLFPGRPYTVTFSEPIIPKKLGKFFQGSFFGKYCKTADGKQALTGCVPLAVGTIMGYYKWPAKSGSYVFDWEYMNAYIFSGNGWPRLFEMLGRPEWLNVIYGTESTSAPGDYIYRVSRTFYWWGYDDVDNYKFQLDKVHSELKAGRPVLCVGSSSKSGHMWILDGGYMYHQEYLGEDRDGKTIIIKDDSYYLHCIWGWAGAGNGYYLYISNLGGTPDKYDETADSFVAPTFSLSTIFTNLQPKK